MRRKLEVKDEKFKILVLLGIATLLGVAIINQQKAKLSSQPTTIPTPSIQPRPLLLNLTAEERFILHPPSAEASRSTKQQHAQTVAKLAKISDTLEINNCQPTPLVLEVKFGSEFRIKNNDKIDQKIIFDQDERHKIPANNSAIIKADFKYGTGDYGYVCKGVGLVGFLHVVE